MAGDSNTGKTTPCVSQHVFFQLVGISSPVKLLPHVQTSLFGWLRFTGPLSNISKPICWLYGRTTLVFRHRGQKRKSNLRCKAGSNYCSCLAGVSLSGQLRYGSAPYKHSRLESETPTRQCLVHNLMQRPADRTILSARSPQGRSSADPPASGRKRRAR